MSYSHVGIFNRGSDVGFFYDQGTASNKLWPFVKMWEKNWNQFEGKYYMHYNGIFYNYDWTEFALYVGGVIVIYLLVRISNKPEDSKT